MPAPEGPRFCNSELTPIQAAERLINDELKSMQQDCDMADPETLVNLRASNGSQSSPQTQQSAGLAQSSSGLHNPLILDDLAVMAVRGPAHWQRTLDLYRHENLALEQTRDSLAQEILGMQMLLETSESAALQALVAETAKWKSNMRKFTDRLYLSD